MRRVIPVAALAVLAALPAFRAGAASPSPTDLNWLRGQCGDGALFYKNGSNIYLTELSTGGTVQISGNIPNGWSMEFSPDGSKMAWLSGTTARGRMRKGDTTVHTIASGVSAGGGIHWVSDTEVVLVKNSKWYKVHIGTGTETEVPQLTSLGTGGTETDVRLLSSGTWCYVNGTTWKTSTGTSGSTGGSCSCSLSPEVNGGASCTGLHHDHLSCSMTRVISGAPTGTLNWAWDYTSPKGFDNHRWSSNNKDFVACQDEKYNYMVVMKVGGTYCTRMGNSGSGEMYGDFTVSNGSGAPWPGSGANNAPTVNLTVDQTSGTAPLTVNFDAHSSDLDGDTLNHDWDWDGDGTYDQDSGTDGTVSHAFSSAGTYNVKVRVSDGTDNTYDQITITVNPPANNPPVVNLTADQTSGPAPLAVNFDAHSSDLDGDTLNHDWDWDGDGAYDQNSGTGATVSHVFDVDGVYTVKVRVSDGTDTVTDTITISAGMTSGALEYQAEADTYVYASNPGTNYGGDDDLAVGGGSSERVIYIRFNVSGLPSDATVTDAKLHVTASNSSSDAAGGGTIRLYGPGNANWDEMVPTWNSPLAGSDASGDLDTIGPIASGSTYDYTNLEQAVTGDGLYTFVIRSSAADGAAFRSSEYGTAADRPKLIVTYTSGGSDAAAPGVTATHAVLSGTVTDNSGPISQVSVGGVNVSVTSGNWASGGITLGGATTNITVTAQDPSSNTATVNVAVTR